MLAGLQRPRVAEAAAKVVTGKDGGGWWEAGRRGVPGSVPSKYC